MAGLAVDHNLWSGSGAVKSLLYPFLQLEHHRAGGINYLDPFLAGYGIG